MDALNRAATYLSEPSASVLLVGGAENDFDTLAGMLAGTGWQTRRAVDGVDAARLCSQQLFPVLICERALPDGDWRALQAGLRSLERTPLLVLTLAWSDEEAWADALGQGAFDVLARPFERAEVTRVLSLAMLAWTTSGRQSVAVATPERRVAPLKQYTLIGHDYRV